MAFKNEAAVRTTIGILLGIAIAFPISGYLIKDTLRTLQSAKTGAPSALPSTIQLEGKIHSFNKESGELIVEVPLPYKGEQSIPLRIKILESTTVVRSDEMYGEEGVAVVYFMEDKRVGTEELRPGRPVYLSIIREEQKFTAAFVRVFKPQT